MNPHVLVLVAWTTIVLQKFPGLAQCEAVRASAVLALVQHEKGIRLECQPELRKRG